MIFNLKRLYRAVISFVRRVGAVDSPDIDFWIMMAEIKKIQLK